MDLLKKFFPLSFKCKNEVKDLVIGIIIYIIAGAIAGVVLALAGLITGWIPVLGAVIGILLGAIGGLAELYVLVGIVLEILLFVFPVSGKVSVGQLFLHGEAKLSVPLPDDEFQV